MKRLLALAIVAMVLVSAPVALAIQFPRQVDPATAPADPVYGQGLYLFYGSVVAALSGGNFTGASHLLQLAQFIHIPADVLSAVDTFDGLINSTADQFALIHAQLDNASAYLGTGRVGPARDNLTSAIANLRSANQTLTQLVAAEPSLASLTGIPPSLLLQKLHPLETQYAEYSALASRLLTVLTGLTRLAPTSVTLSVAQASIPVGSNVTVSGYLAGPSGPLAHRAVTIYFGDAAIGDANTTASGAYSAELRTPFYYDENATIFASYVPSGGDSLVYAPSTSAPAEVRVTFATPVASLSVPGSAYAGQPMVVNGTLELGGRPLGGYTVSLSGFSPSSLAPPEVATATTSPDGSFSLSLVPPSGLGAGSYPITFSTSSNGSVGPLSLTHHVSLVKESPTVASSAPAFAIAGLPVTVSGSASVNGSALAGAQVLNTTPTPGVDTSTSPSGTFTFTVTPPLTTPNGAWDYRVGVYPSQSWITSAPVSVSIFVINPLVLVFPASSLGLLLLVVRRRRPPPQAQAMAPLQRAETDAAPPARAPLTGLPAVYYSAAGLAEKATGVPLRPQMTVREYLAAVRGAFRGFERFATISSLLETSLYAGGGGPGDEARARGELEAMRRELEG
ncbi:MAG: hypothetical protein JRN46_02455 [Nitrososphaerota archaeon]|nr:hypothetical protein [Nitrososphaerota archaeon]